MTDVSIESVERRRTSAAKWIWAVLAISFALPALTYVARELLLTTALGEVIPLAPGDAPASTELWLLAVPAIGIAAGLLGVNWRLLGLSSIALVGVALGMIAGIIGTLELRWHAFQDVPVESAALIAAVGAFEQTRGAPPQQLSDLVPEFLPSVPGTGMPAFSSYQYAASAGPCTAANTWHLRINIDIRVEGYPDFLIYCPKQDYRLEPLKGSYSVTEFRPVGTWLYSATHVAE